jgi:hypothetical protein
MCRIISTQHLCGHAVTGMARQCAKRSNPSWLKLLLCSPSRIQCRYPLTISTFDAHLCPDCEQAQVMKARGEALRQRLVERALTRKQTEHRAMAQRRLEGMDQGSCKHEPPENMSSIAQKRDGEVKGLALDPTAIADLEDCSFRTPRRRASARQAVKAVYSSGSNPMTSRTKNPVMAIRVGNFLDDVERLGHSAEQSEVMTHSGFSHPTTCAARTGIITRASPSAQAIHLHPTGPGRPWHSRRPGTPPPRRSQANQQPAKASADNTQEIDDAGQPLGQPDLIRHPLAYHHENSLIAQLQQPESPSPAENRQRRQMHRRLDRDIREQPLPSYEQSRRPTAVQIRRFEQRRRQPGLIHKPGGSPPSGEPLRRLHEKFEHLVAVPFPADSASIRRRPVVSQGMTVAPRRLSEREILPAATYETMISRQQPYSASTQTPSCAAREAPAKQWLSSTQTATSTGSHDLAGQVIKSDHHSSSGKSSWNFPKDLHISFPNQVLPLQKKRRLPPAPLYLERARKNSWARVQEVAMNSAKSIERGFKKVVAAVSPESDDSFACKSARAVEKVGHRDR